MNNLKSCLRKVAADLVCLFIFGIPLWVYNFLDVVPLTQIGFFCSDNSIRYPYRNSTVASAVMMVSGFAMMLLCGLIVETFLFKKHGRSASGSMFHPLLVELYRLVGYFIIGACMNQFLTDVAKMAIGRLRPHFIDVCQPNVNCTVDNQHIYYDDYVCTRTSHPLIPQDMLAKRMRDARKSFPSGHASFSMYCSLFLIIYLELRVRSNNTRIVRHLAQLGIMAWGFWICCTRIYDYKHRYSDVAGGIFIGAFVAVFAVHLYVRSCNSCLRKLRADMESNEMHDMNGHADSTAHKQSSLTQLNEHGDSHSHS